MKKILSILLAVMMFCSIIPVAYADSYESIAIQDGEEIETRAEQTGWYYRDNNGVLEKRLWSYTYGKWLTDWIPVWD